MDKIVYISDGSKLGVDIREQLTQSFEVTSFCTVAIQQDFIDHLILSLVKFTEEGSIIIKVDFLQGEQALATQGFAGLQILVMWWWLLPPMQ